MVSKYKILIIMKAKFICVIGLLTAGLFYAQEEVSTEIAAPEFESVGKNTIKTNLTAYAFRNFNVTYERSFNKRFTLSASLGMMPSGSIPFMNAFVKEKDRKDISKIDVANTNFTLEGRVYFGKKYNSGFYLAPYYRYTNLKIGEFNYEFQMTPVPGVQVDNNIVMEGNIKAHSFGLMFGVQWLLGKQKNWVLDWWILGGHYGAASGEINGKTTRSMTPQEQKELENELNNLDVPFVKYKTEINSNGGKITMDGPWAGLRSGLSIGYRF